MSAMPADNRSGDGSIAALVFILRFHGIAASEDQIRHRFASDEIDASQIVLCARELRLKSREIKSNWDQLGRVSLPAICQHRNGSFVIVAKVSEGTVLIQDPLALRPQVVSRQDFELLWMSRLILMTRRVALSDLGRRFDVSWFLGAVLKYRRPLVEVFVASFFLQIFSLITPIFFQVVTDKVLVHRGYTTLDVIAGGLVITSVFESVLALLRTYVFSHTTSRIDVELGARLFHHLLALPIAYFTSRPAGQSVARVRELESIRNFLTSSALTLVIDLFFTFVFLSVMYSYSASLTLAVLASFPFYVLLTVVATPVFRARIAEKFNRGAENQSFLVEAVTSVETLKSMAVEPQMQRRWEEQLAGYVQSSFRVLALANWMSQAVQLVGKIVTAAILYFGAREVIAGNLTVGQLIAFNMLAGRVAQPILRIAQVWQDFQQMRISIERVGDILNSIPEPQYNPAQAALPAIQGDIRFEHTTFRYRIDGPEILHDINLSIPAGQVVGIVGPSGSGKSTLAKLVQRLYVPESGRVLVDGVDLAMVDVAWLRRQVGVVLQENVLFNRSIRENIALVDPSLPMERVIAAAHLAGAHDFILQLPQAYDTVVGERGASLSGGQRQRVAIARALISNPRILIFDEATSALDYESERVIQENMRKIVFGRTVLIIAHRLSAVRSCQRILTVDRGRIVEDGTHDELVGAGGRYAALFDLQSDLPGRPTDALQRYARAAEQ